MIAAIFVSERVFRRHGTAANRFSFSLRTLLLMPVVLAPLIIVLFPVRSYQQPYSMIAPLPPFSVVVVDDATGRPILNAAVRPIDPRVALDDFENLYNPEFTNESGTVRYSLNATVCGRQGLLGRTETITYNPWLIEVAAPGYQTFVTSLAGDPPIPADRLTARPLGLTFPPPPSVTIRLTPSAKASGAQGKSEHE
jgi:hypothetical protein